MTEFERQIIANRQRADVQKMNKELQRLDPESDSVQNLNTAETPNEQGERKSS
jgi:hypothetical protein